MMIDAVMYGMIPSAKTANWVMAPPEKVWRKLEHAALVGAGLEVLDGRQVDARHRDVRRRTGRARP